MSDYKNTDRGAAIMGSPVSGVVKGRKRCGSKGFSLVEVVISVAALSFISVFILEMFLVSSTLNNRAKDTDIALAEAVSAVDSFKGGGDIWLESAPGLAEGRLSVQRYYTADWELTELNEAEGGRYCLMLEVSEGNESAGVTTGTLYDVSAEVVDLLNTDEPRTLAAFSTKKYIPDVYTR